MSQEEKLLLEQAECKAKEKKFASMTIEEGLMLMLKRLGKEDCFRKASEKLTQDSVKWGYFAFRQKGSVFQFEGIGRELGLIVVSNIFFIELDVDRRKVFFNELKRRFKRFDAFELETFEDCIVAFD